jgi:hypothetical protein
MLSIILHRASVLETEGGVEREEEEEWRKRNEERRE